jgi:23S rRNA (adenine2030-N6)-methyltransferase
MNYRHAFHAGNFADLLKHAILTRLLRALTAARGPLTIIDTHAGAGLYDLRGDAARRTGEGEAGVGRLMDAADAPRVFDDLKAAVRLANRGTDVRYYPGSPALVESALRPQDRFLACELRADDHAALKAALPRQAGAVVLKANGWTAALDHAPAAPMRLLMLIDPPFERPDDAEQAKDLSARVLRRNAGAVIAIWAPIKDLTTYDALVMDCREVTAPAPMIVAEVRLRPLVDPMRMNGCAMIMINPTPGLDEDAASAAGWISRALGEPGALAKVKRIAC